MRVCRVCEEEEQDRQDAVVRLTELSRREFGTTFRTLDVCMRHAFGRAGKVPGTRTAILIECLDAVREDAS